MAEHVDADRTALTYFDTARHALAQAVTLDEVTIIRDKAEALRRYARHVGEGLTMQNQCAELKLRAERRAGELLEDMRERGERRGRGGAKSQRATLLPELGISKTDSSRWQAVHSVPEARFEQYLAEAKERAVEITSSAVRKIAAAERADERRRDYTHLAEDETCSVEDLRRLIDAGVTFGTIYADPPWPYGNQATRAATDKHYDTPTMRDIQTLPVAALAAPDCHLHLWTTNGFLREAFDVIDAWGFTYKSCFVWVKPTMGIGNYWRVSHEFLLLGIKGRATFLQRNERSWLEAPRGVHSAKPHGIRERIERVSPGPRRIELYAREEHAGWWAWGDQIARSLFARQRVEA